MIQQAIRAHQQLCRTLQDISDTPASTIEKAQQSFREIRASLRELQTLRDAHKFEKQEEEIEYFKKVLPEFIELLIFYSELTRIETVRPPCNGGIQEAFIENTLKMLDSFFQRHAFLYHYYRMGNTEFDPKLFLSGTHEVDFYPDIGPILDVEFCTVGAYIFGKFRAFERLIRYLQGLEEPDNPVEVPVVAWTESKAALIELIYALQARGAIEQGRGPLNDAVRAFEKAFGIQLGNVYRGYYDLCIRKKNRTPFLDALKEALEKRMDESDR